MPTDIPSFREIIDFFFCLCRGAALTTGLAFAQRFVGYAVVKVLITYFTDWCQYNLLYAVGLVNLLEGSSSFLVLAMTYISNKHVSPRKVILYSTAAYIIGMVMFCFSYYYPIPDDKIGMYFVPAVLLISVGKAGGLPILEEFLVRQLTAHEPKPDKDEGRVNARKCVVDCLILECISPPLDLRQGYLGCNIHFFNISDGHRPVDEATTAEISPASPEEKINNGLSVMIPMWTTFLVFGLVLSAGDTFFTDQGNNMDNNPTVSIYVLLVIKNIIRFTPSTFEFITRFTAFPSKISSNISTLLSKFIPKLETQGIIVTIWTAMVLSIFCCSVAWRVEVHRLPMSVMRLAPQFFLLGLMQGLGSQGLDLFFDVQVSDGPMKEYRSALNEAVIGFGSFLNGLLVFLYRSWSCDTLNCSRLDKYYHMLTVVSFVNMCYYWWVSTFYSNKMGTSLYTIFPKRWEPKMMSK